MEFGNLIASIIYPITLTSITFFLLWVSSNLIFDTNLFNSCFCCEKGNFLTHKLYNYRLTNINVDVKFPWIWSPLWFGTGNIMWHKIGSKMVVIGLGDLFTFILTLYSLISKSFNILRPFNLCDCDNAESIWNISFSLYSSAITSLSKKS